VREALSLLGGYGRDRNAVIAFRVPAAVPQLSGRGPAHRFRYWMKVAHPLPADAHLHAAAFAYLSDWWLNFCLLAPLVGRTGGRRMYVASLNHALWLHGVPQADRWLHVSAHGLHATGGHGLAIAQYHDEAGRHVATATQQCLLAYVDEAPAARPQSLSSITTERMSGT
jgi:acyl-CoA thioesterase-2